MLKHWREVKAQHPDTILFYRVGDFYEMFHEDAQLAARVLEITLTSRGDGVPLAGVPVKAAAEYLRQLIGAGHRESIGAGRKPGASPLLERIEVDAVQILLLDCGATASRHRCDV